MTQIGERIATSAVIHAVPLKSARSLDPISASTRSGFSRRRPEETLAIPASILALVPDASTRRAYDQRVP